MARHACLCLTILILNTIPVWAAPPVVVEIKRACYNLAQYKAEQAIRYHSKLMVAGMLCQSQNPKSYSDYQAFTQRNQKTIGRAENILIGYFAAQKRKRPELDFHTLRTDIANTISMKAMQQSIPAFCKTAIPSLKQAASFQARQFDSYLVNLDLKQTSSMPPCKDVKPVAAQAVTPAKTSIKSSISSQTQKK